ncbi:MAG: cbb3-type cytochrome c oxidase subunit I [Verrucomicrobiota bacterium]
MSDTAESTDKTNPHQTPEDVALRASIDRSVRLPVLFFFSSAGVWLIVAMVLGFFQAMKLQYPGFLDYDFLFFLNYPRTRAAFTGALIYGWAIQAGLGVCVWLMARLCRVPLRNPITLIIAGHFWNAGVLFGVLGIFAGFGNSMEWMEFPKWVWPILAASYSMIAVWMITMFVRRREQNVYIAQWYILGACVWFPWLYLTANVFIHLLPGAAVMKTAVNAWYTNGVLFLVLGPMGLAAAYYLIPKILGRPIYSYQLAQLGFWGLAIFGGWAGMHKLVGGPLPSWMPGVGGAATLFMLMPVIAVAINHHMTTRGQHNAMSYSPTMRFTAIGAISYTLLNVVAALYCVFPIAEITQLTLASIGFQMLGIYAFFSMTMFGAIYFIVPRVTQTEWRSAKRINQHFWFSAYGTVMLVGLMIVGGLSQSAENNNLDVPNYSGVVNVGMFYVRGLAVTFLLLLYANANFFFHLVSMTLGLGKKEAEGPTLLGHGAHHQELPSHT